MLLMIDLITYLYLYINPLTYSCLTNDGQTRLHNNSAMGLSSGTLFHQ